MASSGTQSVDELIMCLVGMGFDITDCQQAVQMGKLTVEAAIEWILAGKPGLVTPGGSTGPKLSLRKNQDGQVVGSNPFSNPQPIKPFDPPSSSSQGPEKVEDEEDKVQSRMHLNDEQRQIRDRFEAKQRDEARKKAKLEKLAEKKAREQIKQQIAEDRETQKLRRGGATEQKLPADSSPKKATDAGKPSGNTTKASTDKCLLQIRLPDGRALRQNFSPSDRLQAVWTFVQSHASCDNMCLMQPFPRQEFGADHMSMSLLDLKLVPTGSLVLKKMEASSTVLPSENMGASADLATESTNSKPSNEDEAIADENEDMSDEGPSHCWGSGQKLDNTEAPPVPGQADPAMDVDPVAPDPEPMDSDEEEGDDDIGGWGMPPGQPHAIFGGGPGPGGGGAHLWGEGQRLISENQVLPHHNQSAAQLAAEAARQRFQEHPQGAAPEEMHVSGLTYNVDSLLKVALKLVSSRICDSRNPGMRLQRVPADVAMKILEYLISERLLRPKTLQPFLSCGLKRLMLDCYPYATNELLAAARYHTNVTHVSLCSCPLINDKGLQSLTAMKKLKVLNLGSCRQITNNVIPVLIEFKNLVTLVLEDTGITDSGIQQYAESSPPELQQLNLNRTDVTHHAIPSLQRIPHLRTLSMEQTKLCSLSGVQDLVKLQTLDVGGTNIVTDSLLCLNAHPSLTALNISNTPSVDGNLALQYISGLNLVLLQLPSRLTTTDLGISHIGNMSLQCLDLTNYVNVGDGAMEHVGKIHSLKRLLLSNTKITDGGMIFLEGLINLEVLYLDRTSVTDVGANVIKAFTRLQELSLSGAGVTNQLLKSAVLHQCPNLTKLNLSKTRISNKGVERLRLPLLSLLNLDCTRVRLDVLGKIQGCPLLAKVMMSNLNSARPESEDED